MLRTSLDGAVEPGAWEIPSYTDIRDQLYRAAQHGTMLSTEDVCLAANIYITVPAQLTRDIYCFWQVLKINFAE